MSGSDFDLEGRFGDLRQGREKNAGSFSAAVTKARQRARVRRPQARRRLVLALVASVPVAGALTLEARGRARVRADVETAQQAAPLVQWRSPTDDLMNIPYTDWLSGTPSLLTPTITTSPQPEGGSR